MANYRVLTYLCVDGSAAYVGTNIWTHPSGVLPHWDPASSRHANRYIDMTCVKTSPIRNST